MADEWWLQPNDSLETAAEPHRETARDVKKSGTGAMYWMEDDRWLMCRVEKTGKMLRADIKKTLHSGPDMMIHFEPFILPVGMHRSGPPKKKRKTTYDEPPPEDPFPLNLLNDDVIGLLLINQFWQPTDRNRESIRALSQLTIRIGRIIRNIMERRGTFKEWWKKAFNLQPPRVLTDYLPFPTFEWHKYYTATWKALNSTIESLDTMDDVLSETYHQYNDRNKRLYRRDIDLFVGNFTREIAEKYTANIFGAPALIDLQHVMGFIDQDNGVLYTFTYHTFREHEVTTILRSGEHMTVKKPAVMIRVFFEITRAIDAEEEKIHLEIVRIIPERVKIPLYSLLFFSHLPKNPWRLTRYPSGFTIDIYRSTLYTPQGRALPHHLRNTTRTVQLQPFTLQETSHLMNVNIRNVRIDRSILSMLSPLQLREFYCVRVLTDLDYLSNITIVANRFRFHYEKDDTDSKLLNLNFPNAFIIVIGQVGTGTIIESLNLQWFQRVVEEHKILQLKFRAAGDDQRKRDIVTKEIEEKAIALAKFAPRLVLNNVMMTAGAIESIVEIIEGWPSAAPLNLTTVYGQAVLSFTVIPYVSKDIVLPERTITKANIAEIKTLVTQMAGATIQE